MSPAPQKINKTDSPAAWADLNGELISSDSLFKVAIETSPVGVLIGGPDGTIVLVNHALERQFGYPRHELIGQPFEMLVPGSVQSLHEEHPATRLSDPGTRPMGAGPKLFGRRKDGSHIPVEVELNAARTKEGPFALAWVVDLSERRWLEEENRRRFIELLKFEQLVGELSAAFVNLAADQIDQNIVDAQRRIVEALGLDRSALFQVSEDKADFVLTHHWARPGSPGPPLALSGARKFPWSLAQLRNGEPAVFSSVEDVPDPIERETLRFYGTKSRAGIPFSIGGRIVGVITLASSSEERLWPEEIIGRLSLVAQVFTSAMARKQHDTALRSALDEVARLSDRLQAENGYLRREVKEPFASGPIVGRSAAIRLVFEQLEQVAVTDSTVLLLGETGTGKELLAAQIHERSTRRGRTMVRVNCAAIPATLIESELFGREKGAFTGALARQIGRFGLADNSTIFLDEIGDLPLEVQVKLLRVLEEKQIERLGNPNPIHINTRIIAATHRNLEQMVAQGTFREDLYYRINVFPIYVPPLRDRIEDIPLLVWRFVEEFSKTFGKPVESIPKETIAALQQYSWPGNIRELRNVVERAMITTTKTRLMIPLPHLFTAAGSARHEENQHSTNLADVERDHIRRVLENTKWRIRGKGGAADRLGLKPTTLDTRLAKLGLTRPLRP